MNIHKIALIVLSITTQNNYAFSAEPPAVERAYSDALHQIRNKDRASLPKEQGAKITRSLNAALGPGAKSKREAAAQKAKPSRSKKDKTSKGGKSPASVKGTDTAPETAEHTAPILDEATIPRELQFGNASKSDPVSPHVHNDPNQKLEELEF